MNHIFISYASTDKPRVQRLVDVLTQQGLDVWWDKSIPPGRSFDEVIEEALATVRCVIVVWSNQSVLSKWVKIEAMEGDRRNVLVPVLFDDVRIPLEFRRIQAAKLMDWDGTPTHPELAKLLKSVQSLLAADVAPAGPAALPKAPAAPRGGWLSGFVTDYFAGGSLWSVRVAVIAALTASLLLLMLSGKVANGNDWLRIGPWGLTGRTFVLLLYSLVPAAYLWSALVSLAVSAAADARYKSLAAVAVLGLFFSGPPLYWFIEEGNVYTTHGVAPTEMSVVGMVASCFAGGVLSYLLVRLKRTL